MAAPVERLLTWKVLVWSEAWNAEGERGICCYFKHTPITANVREPVVFETALFRERISLLFNEIGGANPGHFPNGNDVSGQVINVRFDRFINSSIDHEFQLTFKAWLGAAGLRCFLGMMPPSRAQDRSKRSLA